MRYDRFLSAALMVAVVVAIGASVGPFFLGSRTASGEETGEPGAPHPDRVVVVELFTSQGCSSCPPADRLLSRLGSDPQLAGRIVPLSFHVDYWDRLGWRDPFSSAAWTARQERYARALRARSLYTPQMVVNGEREMVGNAESRVRDAIRHSLAEPPAGTLDVRLGKLTGGELPVTVHAELTGGRPHDLVLALFQTGLETEVPRGENAGRHLANDYVVRHLEEVAELTSDAPNLTKTFRLPVEPDWTSGDLGVAAFLQDAKTLAVGAAAVAHAPRIAR